MTWSAISLHIIRLRQAAWRKIPVLPFHSDRCSIYSHHNLITGVCGGLLELHGLDFSLAVNFGTTIKCAEIAQVQILCEFTVYQYRHMILPTESRKRCGEWLRLNLDSVGSLILSTAARPGFTPGSHHTRLSKRDFNGARFSGLSSPGPEHRSCNNISLYKLIWTARIVNRIHIRMWAGENEVSVSEPKEAVHQHGVEW